ncbi:MAG: NDP-sugar synthase [Clostridiales bacterium]|nr:NDP-sugar synthase [Clostridiales bacterium]
MKAVIMAGGMGTRLRPICDEMPKPMTRLLGKPLLEHLIELLKKNGFNELCITLAHKPEYIKEYFGDGKNFDVSIEYRVEENPLGTAGGVRACMDFVGGEDFLVISGDAACDFDLKKLFSEHGIHGGLITMALYPHPEPLRYGTVITDRKGKVVSFIEKPSWEKVVTDLVNTGVYIVSPKAMELVPEGKPYDFARDLFPHLTAEGCIIGIPMEGYWCDIGDAKSYHQSCMHALDGRLKLSPFRRSASVFSNLKAFEWPQIFPPSLICQGAIIEKGAVIEHSIIHAGSKIGAYSRIINSVIDGGDVGKNCHIEGSVVCKGATLPPHSITRFGDIVSQGCISKAAAPASAATEPRQARGLCRELACTDRARLMREMSYALWEAGADFSDGINISDGKCKIRISPLPEESAITIEAMGGGENERLAMCKKYSKLAEKFGGKNASTNIH